MLAFIECEIKTKCKLCSDWQCDILNVAITSQCIIYILVSRATRIGTCMAEIEVDSGNLVGGGPILKKGGTKCTSWSLGCSLGLSSVRSTLRLKLTFLRAVPFFLSFYLCMCRNLDWLKTNKQGKHTRHNVTCMFTRSFSGALGPRKQAQ